MLTDASKKGKQLVTGSGPVNGPATQASSTRSELHGFAAPLEYIHQLTRYYSMRPKGEYKWECDRQCALNRIEVVLKFGHQQQQPYNADIISNLTQRLDQNRSMTIKSTWVKAHQDEKRYQAKYCPTLLCGISRWTASPKIIYSTPVNPRLQKMLCMWMLKPSAYVFKEQGSQAEMRMLFAKVLMDPIFATI
jgi:ribonuclease HI